MHVEARTTEDFYGVLEPAYERLLQKPEADVLDVTLAPGEYHGILNLSDRRERGHVGIIVRAADPQQPPVFKDGGLKLSGRDVRLERILFRGIKTNTPAVSIRTLGNLAINGCAFLGCMYDGSRDNRSLIDLRAAGLAGQTASIRNCWFVGNSEVGKGSLIDTIGLPGQRFARLDVEQTVFLDNPFTHAVVPGAAEAVSFVGCIIEALPGFVSLRYISTQLGFRESLIVSERMPDLVSFEAAPSSSAPALHPVVTIDDSLLALKQPFEAQSPFECANIDVRPAPADLSEYDWKRIDQWAREGYIPKISEFASLLGLL